MLVNYVFITSRTRNSMQHLGLSKELITPIHMKFRNWTYTLSASGAEELFKTLYASVRIAIAVYLGSLIYIGISGSMMLISDGSCPDEEHK